MFEHVLRWDALPSYERFGQRLATLEENVEEEEVTDDEKERLKTKWEQ